jgi:uncharacterized protein YndB with AHSA1/START domain
MAAEPLTASVHIEAAPEQVFEYFTSPEALVRWMGDHAALQPTPGGAFEVDINGVPVRGRYLEVDPPRRVVVSWGVAGSTGMPPGATRVEFTLSPTEGGTRLRLVHRNLPPDEMEMHSAGWGYFLSRLSQAAGPSWAS